MKQFEMKFRWDDKEEAHYRGTKAHEQIGMLTTWKLKHETVEEFKKRTNELVKQKMKFLRDILTHTPATFAEVISSEHK